MREECGQNEGGNEDSEEHRYYDQSPIRSSLLCLSVLACAVFTFASIVKGEVLFKEDFEDATPTSNVKHSKPMKPNIILINCDDLGIGDLGCYGSTINKTPALDRLAAEGTRFTDFSMASSICTPSRAAMLTGCYPQRISLNNVLFPGDADGLHPDEETIASMLKREGYSTALIGKWHLGDQPEFLPGQFGFDHYFGMPFSNDMGRQVGDNPDKAPLPLLKDSSVIEEQPEQSGLTARYVEESLEFMRDSVGKKTPFFLYFAHMYVHLPLYVPEAFMKDSENGRYGGAVACID